MVTQLLGIRDFGQVPVHEHSPHRANLGSTSASTSAKSTGKITEHVQSVKVLAANNLQVPLECQTFMTQTPGEKFDFALPRLAWDLPLHWDARPAFQPGQKRLSRPSRWKMCLGRGTKLLYCLHHSSFLSPNEAIISTPNIKEGLALWMGSHSSLTRQSTLYTGKWKIKD